MQHSEQVGRQFSYYKSNKDTRDSNVKTCWSPKTLAVDPPSQGESSKIDNEVEKSEHEHLTNIKLNK
jgi:hypothetical protein